MRAFRRLAGAGLALMLGVVAASAWIRIAASLGEEVALARGLQRAAATATALAVLALAALAWLERAGARQLYFKYCSTFDSTDAGNIGPVSRLTPSSGAA